MNKNRKFFRNKTCDYCKSPGTIIRFYGKRSMIICDKKECDKKCRMNLGIFKTKIDIKG